MDAQTFELPHTYTLDFFKITLYCPGRQVVGATADFQPLDRYFTYINHYNLFLHHITIAFHQQHFYRYEMRRWKERKDIAYTVWSSWDEFYAIHETSNGISSWNWKICNRDCLLWLQLHNLENRQKMWFHLKIWMRWLPWKYTTFLCYIRLILRSQKAVCMAIFYQVNYAQQNCQYSLAKFSLIMPMCFVPSCCCWWEETMHRNKQIII